MADESLSAFVESVCGDSHLRVEDDLGGGFVRLKISEAERRQAAHDIRSTEDIVIEMLRNARDAHARSIFLAVGREGDVRRLTVLDDGDGVPPSMHEQVFEPRVTSKLDTAHVDKWGVHGRGMALYSISMNASKALIVASDSGMGSSFLVETDLNHLGEKADQSTFPSFERTEAGTIAVKGPRNIIRTSCEFSLEHRQDCTVYLGSATDIAATLRDFGNATLSRTARAFCDDYLLLPVCKRLCTAADPGQFAQIAASLGLDISERSARRIMDDDIAPVSPLLDRLRIGGNPSHGPQRPPRARAKSEDARGLKVDSADLDSFADGVADVYRSLARDYFLDPSVKPDVSVGKNQIHIVIPVEKLR